MALVQAIVVTKLGILVRLESPSFSSTITELLLVPFLLRRCILHFMPLSGLGHLGINILLIFTSSLFDFDFCMLKLLLFLVDIVNSR